MNKKIKTLFHGGRQAFSVSLVLMVICGFLFPILLTGLSAIFFPYQAEGSLLKVKDKAVASENVGQEFLEDYYMWSRPSAYHYNVYTENKEGDKRYQDGSEFPGIASGSNNYAPSNPELIKRVEADMQDFLDKNKGIQPEDISTDLLTASGSGLDPHISPESARIQIPRIVEASGLSKTLVQNIIKKHTNEKLLGVLGEESVNVVKVNIEIAKEMGLIQDE